MDPRGWSNDKYLRFENIFSGGLTFPSNLFGLVPELRVSTCARTPEQALYHEVGGGCAHEKRRIPSVLGVRQTVLGVIRVMSARAGVSPVNARRDNSFEIREQWPVAIRRVYDRGSTFPLKNLLDDGVP